MCIILELRRFKSQKLTRGNMLPCYQRPSPFTKEPRDSTLRHKSQTLLKNVESQLWQSKDNKLREMRDLSSFGVAITSSR